MGHISAGNLNRTANSPIPPIPDVLPFKTLILKLTQAGVIAPVVNSEINDIGIAYTLAYVALGEYTVDFVAPITADVSDIHCIAPTWQAEGNSNPRNLSIVALSTIQLRIRSGVLNAPGDGSVFVIHDDNIIGQSSSGSGDSFSVYVPNP